MGASVPRAQGKGTVTLYGEAIGTHLLQAEGAENNQRLQWFYLE